MKKPPKVQFDQVVSYYIENPWQGISLKYNATSNTGLSA